MAQEHRHSPYTTPEGMDSPHGPDYPTQESDRFAAPGLDEENGYVDLPGLGYAAPHRVPVPVLADVVFDRRPDASRHPDEFWQPITDVPERHMVEDQDADGFEKFTERRSGKGAAPHAESQRPAEHRPTMLMSPHTYSFTRPFDQHSERQLNGFHFSMADHRRTYEVVGTAPVRTARNTYRIEPTPWDADIVDVPPAYEPDSVQARVVQVELPQSLDRSHRLM